MFYYPHFYDVSRRSQLISTQDCSCMFHLGCGLERGVLLRGSDNTAYCPAHIPFQPVACPAPRLDCPLCSKPCGRDVIICPSCKSYIDRTCLQNFADNSNIACPSCCDHEQFKAVAEEHCIVLNISYEESELVANNEERMCDLIVKFQIEVDHNRSMAVPTPTLPSTIVSSSSLGDTLQTESLVDACDTKSASGDHVGPIINKKAKPTLASVFVNTRTRKIDFS